MLWLTDLPLRALHNPVRSRDLMTRFATDEFGRRHV
jgi:hypothetical protein